MALNTYFNNFSGSGEQRLLEDLIIESIQIYGQEMTYLPRTRGNFDKLYGADDQSSFNTAIDIEMYIKTYEGFQGDGVFMSKFNLEIRDQVVFTVSKSRFEDVVQTEANILRPNEGDLIYFPLHNKIFEIKFVDYKPFFYMLNKLQTYDLRCELFEYSDEKFNTGIREIDSIQTNFTTDILQDALFNELLQPLENEHGNYLTFTSPIEKLELSVPEADNLELQIEGDNILNFDEINPLTDRTY